MTAPLVPAVFTPVPQRTQGQTDFDNNADAFLASLPPFQMGLEALGIYLDALAVQVDLDAASATASAASALSSANNADVSEAAALASENAALASANASQVSRVASEAAASTASTAATNSLANANSASASASSAANSLTGTLNAAGLSGARAFASYAAAIAGLGGLTNGQSVFVVTDETRSNQGAFYTASGTPVTSLVFSRLHEYYTSPVSYIQSDSLQNMVTKLLTLVGAIPSVPALINADFTDPTY